MPVNTESDSKSKPNNEKHNSDSDSTSNIENSGQETSSAHFSTQMHVKNETEHSENNFGNPNFGNPYTNPKTIPIRPSSVLGMNTSFQPPPQRFVPRQQTGHTPTLNQLLQSSNVANRYPDNYGDLVSPKPGEPVTNAPPFNQGWNVRGNSAPYLGSSPHSPFRSASPHNLYQGGGDSMIGMGYYAPFPGNTDLRVSFPQSGVDLKPPYQSPVPTDQRSLHPSSDSDNRTPYPTSSTESVNSTTEPRVTYASSGENSSPVSVADNRMPYSSPLEKQSPGPATDPKSPYPFSDRKGLYPSSPTADNKSYLPGSDPRRQGIDSKMSYPPTSDSRGPYVSSPTDMKASFSSSSQEGSTPSSDSDHKPPTSISSDYRGSYTLASGDNRSPYPNTDHRGPYAPGSDDNKSAYPSSDHRGPYSLQSGDKSPYPNTDHRGPYAQGSSDNKSPYPNSDHRVMYQPPYSDHIRQPYQHASMNSKAPPSPGSHDQKINSNVVDKKGSSIQNATMPAFDVSAALPGHEPKIPFSGSETRISGPLGDRKSPYSGLDHRSGPSPSPGSERKSPFYGSERGSPYPPMELDGKSPYPGPDGRSPYPQGAYPGQEHRWPMYAGDHGGGPEQRIPPFHADHRVNYQDRRAASSPISEQKSTDHQPQKNAQIPSSPSHGMRNEPMEHPASHPPQSPNMKNATQDLASQNSNDSVQSGSSGGSAMRPTPSPTGSTGSRSMSPAIASQSSYPPSQPGQQPPSQQPSPLPQHVQTHNYKMGSSPAPAPMNGPPYPPYGPQGGGGYVMRPMQGGMPQYQGYGHSGVHGQPMNQYPGPGRPPMLPQHYQGWSGHNMSGTPGSGNQQPLPQTPNHRSTASPPMKPVPQPSPSPHQPPSPHHNPMQHSGSVGPPNGGQRSHTPPHYLKQHLQQKVGYSSGSGGAPPSPGHSYASNSPTPPPPSLSMRDPPSPSPSGSLSNLNVGQLNSSITNLGPEAALDDVSQQSSISNTSAASMDDGRLTPKRKENSGGMMMGMFGSGGASGPPQHVIQQPAPMNNSAPHDEYNLPPESGVSQWSRTPASPIFNSHNSHIQPDVYRPTVKKHDSLSKLYDMNEGGPERRMWLDKLFSFMDERGTSITTCPTISKHPLDLYRLYLYVKERGGFMEVCKVTKNKTWKDIAGLLGIGASSSAAYTLRRHYTKNLLPFECHFDRGGIDPQPIINQLESSTKKKASKNSVNAPSPGSSTSQESYPGAAVPGSMDGYNYGYPSEYANQRAPPMQNSQGILPPGGYAGQPGYGQYPPPDQYGQQYGNYPRSMQYPGYPPPEGGSPGGPTGAPNPEAYGRPYHPQSMYPPRSGGPFQPPVTSSSVTSQSTSPPVSSPTAASPTPAPITSQAGFHPPLSPQAQQQPQSQDYFRHTDPAYDQNAGGPPQQAKPGMGAQIRRHPDFGMKDPSQPPSPQPPQPPYAGPPYGSNQQRPPYAGGWPPNNATGPYRSPYPGGTPPPGGGPGPSAAPPSQQPQWNHSQSIAPRPPIVSSQAPSLTAQNNQWDPQRFPPNSQSYPPNHQASGSHWNASSPPPGIGQGSPLRGPPPRGMNFRPDIKPYSQMPPSPHPVNKMIPGVSGPPGSPSAPIKKETAFPPDCVESVTPVLYKRKRLQRGDVAPVDAWKLFMSLKSGLLAETCWALDVLNILLFDEVGIQYFGLAFLPGLLDVLLEHFNKSLKDMLESPKIQSDKWYEIKRESSPEPDLGQIVEPIDVRDRLDFKANLPDYTNKSRQGLPVTFTTSHSNWFVRSEKRSWDNFVSDLNDVLDPDTGYIVPCLKGELGIVPFVKEISGPSPKKCKNMSASEIEAETKIESSPKIETSAANIKSEFDTKDSKLKNPGPKDDKSNLKDELEIKKEPGVKLENCVDLSKNCENSNSQIKMKIKEEIKDEIIDERGEDYVTEKKSVSLKLPSDINQSIFETDPDVLKAKLRACNVNIRDPMGVLKHRRLSQYEDECYARDESSLYLINDTQDAIARRCLCLSTVIRNLTFVPGNETEFSKCGFFLSLMGKLLLLHHDHPLRLAKQQNYDREEDADYSDCCSSLQGDSEWWWNYLEQIRENTMVSLSNIAGYLDLSKFSEDLVRPILDGLLHWAVCSAAQGQDGFSTAPALSPQKLALETLCKLCVRDANVDLVIATPPCSRLDRLATVLTKFLCKNEDQILREFAINLLHYFAAADSSMSRVIALSGPCVASLVAFIEHAEQSALGVANQLGIAALRDNPDSMGTSLDMLRRAARTLLHLVQHPDNVTFFLQQEQRLLALVMSQILDQQVASVISQVLYQCACAPPQPLDL